MLCCVVTGSRTWMWQIAAPARAASRHAFAICSGVTGRPGCCCTVVMPPVTAQVMMVLPDMSTPAHSGHARRSAPLRRLETHLQRDDEDQQRARREVLHVVGRAEAGDAGDQEAQREQ